MSYARKNSVQEELSVYCHFSCLNLDGCWLAPHMNQQVLSKNAVLLLPHFYGTPNAYYLSLSKNNGSTHLEL